jgi:hypothetical protein
LSSTSTDFKVSLKFGSAFTTTPNPEPTSAILTKGQTMFGYYSGGGLYSTDQSFQTTEGGRFVKVLKQYCDFSTNNQGKPGASGTQALAMANDGHSVWIRVDPRIFSNNTSQTACTATPQAAGGTTTPYANPWFGDDDVLDGGCDAQIDLLGESISNMPGVHILDYRGEPDLLGRRTTSKLAPHLFPQAVRYVYNRLRTGGCTNFEMAHVMAATQSNPLVPTSTVSTADGSMTLQQMFATFWGTGVSGGPVSDVVKIVAADPYWDAAGMTASVFMNYYNGVQAGWLGDPAAKDLFFALGEWGVGMGFATNADRVAAIGTVVAECVPFLNLMVWFDSSFGDAWHSPLLEGTSDGSLAAALTMMGSMT